MRVFLILICFSYMFLGCEDTQTNDPALQAEFDDMVFRAIDARVTENEDGTYLIQGITQYETLTLRVSDLNSGTYNFGGNSANYASFENFNGDTYYTNPLGSGEVIISNWNEAEKKVSGSFKFKGIITGVDTLVVDKGIFFEAPVYSLVIDDEDEGPSGNAGTFVSYIDDNPFNPFNVSAVSNSNSILIEGSTTNRSVKITLPIGVTEGNVSLPENGFQITYADGDGIQPAVTGNIIIFEHLVGAKRIKGTFSFQTATKTISLGQFNVRYE